MRAQPLSQQETQVVNAMTIMHPSDRGRIAVVASHDHWGSMTAFAFVDCKRHSTWDVSISLKRVDQLVVLPIITDSALFQHLADRWRKERGATSSVTQMAMCRSYQRIIGMGSATAVPLILGDLNANPDQPDHWFWALQVLTGEDPVPENARGDMRQMARAWLDWGRRNGYA